MELILLMLVHYVMILIAIFVGLITWYAHSAILLMESISQPTYASPVLILNVSSALLTKTNAFTVTWDLGSTPLISNANPARICPHAEIAEPINIYV